MLNLAFFVINCSLILLDVVGFGVLVRLARSKI